MKLPPALKKRVFGWTLASLCLGVGFVTVSWAPTFRVLLRKADAGTEGSSPSTSGPSAGPGPAPSARVPAPRALTMENLPAPRVWWSREDASHDLAFHTDLDYFAPLGDGPANAALWLGEFAMGGRRYRQEPRVILANNHDGIETYFFAPDDPVFLEAERWVDQKTCRFYPDVWPVDGNYRSTASMMMFAANSAKSWEWRGDRSQDLARAKEDYRRAIRLGRLLLQDRVDLLQHLIGLTCIARGLHGLNSAARREGDALMAAATSVALAECAAIRQGFRDRVEKLEEPLHRLHLGWLGYTVDVPPAELDSIVATANTDPERELRLEAQDGLWVLVHVGPRAQRTRAREALTALAGSPDALVAARARWLEQRSPTRGDLEMLGRN